MAQVIGFGPTLRDLTGVFNRLEDLVGGSKIDNESIVNLPNWLPLTFRIDAGEWFDVDAVELLSYRQTLNLREAVLTRELRFRDDAFHAYFSNPAYIGMITERFGPEVAAHIRNAGSTRLRRQLLE